MFSRRVDRNPARCTRTTYSPGGSASRAKRPRASVTAIAVVTPSAETIAPASGPPRSSLTLPRMLPRVTRAGWFEAMNRGGVWAYAAAAVVPTTRTAMTIRFRRPMDSSVAPLRRHREVYVLRQRFRGVRQFVGDLDLEPVVPF